MEAPREALRYMTKELLEFDENRMDVICCGGGGLLQAVNNEMRLGIVTKRLEQAKDKQADILVSACPSCKLAFVDGVRESKIDIEVLDVIELAARQLGLL
jgi:Fe-S oxidoreductase